MTPWRLLIDPVGRPGWYNMALDQWLLDEAERTGEGFVRLYGWAPFCLSFGRHEPAGRRYDRALIEARGIGTVRRPTGGRAVWHARELTYAVAAPVTAFGDDLARPVSSQAFLAIHAALLKAIRRLGAGAVMAPPTGAAPVSAGACFASPAGGEIMVGPQKLLGSAQLRQGNAFLQHGSLLLEDTQTLVADLTLGGAESGHDITLKEATGRSVGFVEAASAVVNATRSWGGEWHPRPAPPEEALAEHAARFRDPEWTWRR